jgi:hypothetical protein
MIVGRAALWTLVPRASIRSFISPSCSRDDDRSNGSASVRVLSSAQSMRASGSLSGSREDDRLVRKDLGRVLIALGANDRASTPSFSLGSCRSRGHPSRYARRQASAQGAPTAPAQVPAQRMPAPVPAAALEPALLPGPGLPAATPSLASGAPPGETAPEPCGQSPARPGPEGAPSARQDDTTGR